jgi:hypothetical protein
VGLLTSNGSGRRLLAAGALLALVGSAALFSALRSRNAPHPVARLASAKPVAPVDPRIEDPVDPGHPPTALEPRDPAFRGIAGLRAASDEWVHARPAAELRSDAMAADRRGNDPCNTPDPGFGPFIPWRTVGAGSFTLPERGVPAADGNFDLVLHFHGHELARKEFVRASLPFVLFGSSAGNYRNRLGGSQALAQLVSLVEKLLSDRSGQTAHARHVVLAAWSGGYEAVGVLLEQSTLKPDAVILLDGLHFSRERNAAHRQLAPFLDYARRAAAGQGFLFISHSSIDTDSFASSTESAHQLIAALGGRPLRVQREDALGLRLVEMFSLGNVHVRGYAGGNKPDHCAHLALYPMALRAVQRHLLGKIP